MQHELAAELVAYMRHKEYRIAENPGEVNIIYLEGGNLDGTVNPDMPDRWNDRRIVLSFYTNGIPQILLNTASTSEPGMAATITARARRLGGVARVAIRQYLGKWRVGSHKGDSKHPALVQAAQIHVYRDKNRDFMRTGDAYQTATGINQHSTRPGWYGKLVGMWSEGCLVGRDWKDHLLFMSLIRNDPRYIEDKTFAFDTTIIDTSDFAMFKKKVLYEGQA